MSKADEAIEKAIINRENKNLLRFFRTATVVCVTATVALTGLLYNFGIYLYNNSEATQAAIDTFIEVKKHNDKV
jgi:hypothetical protein